MKFLCAAVLLALAPTAALAWSNQGHMATGAIAYDTLMATDPATVDKIVAIMAHHPDRARFERSLAGTKGAERTRRLFEDMARWPDDIRETPWTHPEWHYHARIVAGWSGIMTFSVGTADTAYAENLAILNNPRRPAADRAIALCWLFHIVGDMHEPLHAGHRMDWRFPLTDRLGTIAYVRTGKDAASVTFHDLWDSALDRPGLNVRAPNGSHGRRAGSMPGRRQGPAVSINGSAKAGHWRHGAPMLPKQCSRPAHPNPHRYSPRPILRACADWRLSGLRRPDDVLAC